MPAVALIILGLAIVVLMLLPSEPKCPRCGANNNVAEREDAPENRECLNCGFRWDENA